ncbi:MAG: cytochrome C [Myxococcota bacterium]
MSVLLALLLAAAPDAGVDAPMKKGVPDVVGALKGFTKKGHEGTTQCAACHATSSWSDVRFNHDRTGFPLTGRHAKTSCKACHVADFTAPLPRTCAGCHVDVHSGELGARCESCHDTTDWRSRFDADAHRRTNFPLLGGHAALPCVECHAEARERRFARATVDCLACHQAAALRTAGLVVDHTPGALNLVAEPCQSCHLPTAWSPARFTTHDVCFPITGGPHRGVPCLSCHSALAAPRSACRTGTATLCVSCHTNAGGSSTGQTDAQHQGVPGYVFSAARCAQCHAGDGAGVTP